MATPRMTPVPSEHWDDETRGLLGDGATLNIFATFAHHPKLMKRWMVFGNHVLAKSTLPARDRELLILRTGWNCQHVAIARGIGVTDAEIAMIAIGPDAEGWDPFEAQLLRAADELHSDQSLSDATYQALSETYAEPQLLDLVFTVGQYHVVSMALNSMRVERDDGVTGVPFPQRD
jgi:4-carboxymuconolactone decarboxylase